MSDDIAADLREARRACSLVHQSPGNGDGSWVARGSRLEALADDWPKWVRVPEGDGPFGLLDGELVPLVRYLNTFEHGESVPLYRFPVAEGARG